MKCPPMSAERSKLLPETGDENLPKKNLNRWNFVLSSLATCHGGHRALGGRALHSATNGTIKPIRGQAFIRGQIPLPRWRRRKNARGVYHWEGFWTVNTDTADCSSQDVRSAGDVLKWRREGHKALNQSSGRERRFGADYALLQRKSLAYTQHFPSPK
jgi:hypothetical protein